MEASLSSPLPPIEKITMLNTLGALLYRAGRFEDSIEKIAESIRNRGDSGVIEDWLFLTMAHQRLGNVDAARRWLEMSRSEMEKMKQSMKPGRRFLDGQWERTTTCEFLLKEAEALTKNK